MRQLEQRDLRAAQAGELLDERPERDAGHGADLHVPDLERDVDDERTEFQPDADADPEGGAPLQRGLEHARVVLGVVGLDPPDRERVPPQAQPLDVDRLQQTSGNLGADVLENGHRRVDGDLSDRGIVVGPQSPNDRVDKEHAVVVGPFRPGGSEVEELAGRGRDRLSGEVGDRHVVVEVGGDVEAGDVRAAGEGAEDEVGDLFRSKERAFGEFFFCVEGGVVGARVCACERDGERERERSRGCRKEEEE